MNTAVADVVGELLGPRFRNHHPAPADDRRDPGPLDTWSAVSLAAGRDRAEVDRVVTGAYHRSMCAGDRRGASAAASVCGRLALVHGRPVTAVRWLRRVSIDVEIPEARSVVRSALALQAQAEALLGHDVSATLAGLATACTTAPAPASERGDLALAEAWAAAALGDARRGSELLLAAAVDCADLPAEEARLLHDALRLGAIPARVAPRLVELAKVVDGPTSTLFAQHAEALAWDDGLALDLAAAAFETLGFDLLAAEVWGEAALAYRRRGRRASSAALTLGNARMAAARCEGAITPVLTATLDRRGSSVASGR